MAFVTDIHCEICGKTKREVTYHDNTCNECRTTEASKKKRIFLAGLKGLTIEERLNRVEEYLYDLNCESRLRSIEAETARY